MRRSQYALVALALFAVLAQACGGAGTAGSGGTKATIKVGSFNFPESVVLGELYAQALEGSGYTVLRKFNLGNREIVFPALEKGEVDVVPEYLATVLRFVDKTAKGSTDAAEASRQLQDAVKAKNLTVLDFAQAVDQNVFVVTKATADKYRLKKTSDVATNAQGLLVLGGSAECPQRPFCKLGLEQTYGIKFKDFKALDAGGPLTVAALDGGQVDAANLFSSDAVISVKGYVVLEDDKHLQLADNVAPLARNAVVTDDLKKVLNSISAKLTTDELIAINRANVVDKKDAKDVAKDWLKKMGIVK